MQAPPAQSLGMLEQGDQLNRECEFTEAGRTSPSLTRHPVPTGIDTKQMPPIREHSLTLHLRLSEQIPAAGSREEP